MLTDSDPLTHFGSATTASTAAIMPVDPSHDSPSRRENKAATPKAAPAIGQFEASQPELFETQPPPWELVDAEELQTASIVFAEAPHGPFDYLVPAALLDAVQPGVRVRVPLGKRKLPLTGWCIETKRVTARSESFREVAAVIDSEPLCDRTLVQLVLWISHYYQTPAGVVFDTLVPSGVRAAAGTREQKLYTPDPQSLDDRIVDALPAKQRTALRFLIAAGKPMSLAQWTVEAQCTEGPIRQLLRKGLVGVQTRRVMSHDIRMAKRIGEDESQPIEQLTSEQAAALQTVVAAIDSGQAKTLLLHGVTGSGKTEVYIRAIQHVVRFGRGAIVLVPEISLTPQTRARFENRFAGVAVLHSQMSPTERHFQWQRIRSGEVQVVVGPRSAVFAPLPRLGLIVIDEEHDASFKQDTQPRYHARRVAHRRASLAGIPLLLGSATPSLESWHATHTGHAELIRMDNRIADRPMPSVQLVDLRQRDERGGGAISRPLANAITQTLRDDGQVILLLNRRGFATTIQCPACGHVVACPDCDMPLTHHRDGSKAICHYCDYTIATPPWCPACRFDGIRYGGLGTQRLEVEVKARFPDVQVARMDSDTMRRPGSHQRVLSAFRSGEIRILLGTQMIAKGLDFPNVLLVGVINADSALHFPDFRAAERTFQLVTQVAGRTGRGDRGGNVIVQTFSPEHPAIIAASHHDFVGFAEGEMIQRRKFDYPPLGSVARIILRGSNEEATEIFAEKMRDSLESARAALGAEVRILGPAPPPIAKLRGKYRFHILMQSTNNAALGETVRRGTAAVSIPAKDDIQFVIDIDPMDML
ncbi:MAG: replication restart helicase PriA [Planctomycetaceae bacterium]